MNEQAAPLPYGRQHVTDEDVARVTDVLRSAWLTTGPTVDAFEAALSSLVGGHPVVAVNSGTAALHGAYEAIGVGPDTDVVVPPLTFAATATAALHLGATVRFADIDDRTLLLDPDAAAASATSATAAVTPVDFAGLPCDITTLRERLPAGATVISDAAHSIGGRQAAHTVGSLADLTTFSFHPVKTITTGEGGAVVARDPAHAEAVRRFRNHGLVREDAALHRPDAGPWHQEVQSLGLNYRLPDINAALGLSQLERLPDIVARRAELVGRYRENLGGHPGIRLQHVPADVSPAWHLFVVRVEKSRRRAVFERMRAARIGVQVHYEPVHLHPVFRTRGHGEGDLPVAEEAAAELISLPLYPELTTEQQDRVIRELRAALA